MSFIVPIPITDPSVLPRWCDMTSEVMAITIKARPNEIVYRCFKECGFRVPPLVLWNFESGTSFWSTFSATGTAVSLGTPGGVVNGTVAC